MEFVTLLHTTHEWTDAHLREHADGIGFFPMLLNLPADRQRGAHLGRRAAVSVAVRGPGQAPYPLPNPQVLPANCDLSEWSRWDSNPRPPPCKGEAMASRTFAGVQIRANNAHFLLRSVVLVRRRLPRLVSGLVSTGDGGALPPELMAAVRAVPVRAMVSKPSQLPPTYSAPAAFNTAAGSRRSTLARMPPSIAPVGNKLGGCATKILHDVKNSPQNSFGIHQRLV